MPDALSTSIITLPQLLPGDPFFSPVLKEIEEKAGHLATDGRLVCRSCPACNWMEIVTDRQEETEVRGKCLAMGGDITPFGTPITKCDTWHRARRSMG